MIVLSRFEFNDVRYRPAADSAVRPRTPNSWLTPTTPRIQHGQMNQQIHTTSTAYKARVSTEAATADSTDAIGTVNMYILYMFSEDK